MIDDLNIKSINTFYAKIQIKTNTNRKNTNRNRNSERLVFIVKQLAQHRGNCFNKHPIVLAVCNDVEQHCQHNTPLPTVNVDTNKQHKSLPVKPKHYKSRLILNRTIFMPIYTVVEYLYAACKWNKIYIYIDKRHLTPN